MPDSTPASQSLFEKLSHFLFREPQDRIQLMQLLKEAQSRELLGADALQMIQGALAVSEMKARDIMVQKLDMIALCESDNLAGAIEKIVQSPHSRFPLLSVDQEQIIGIILAKDVLRASTQGTPITNLAAIARPAMLIPESKRLDHLLKEFRLNRNHMAILLDEYGTLSGLITLEDVLEQIVGDIIDEHDQTDISLNIEQTENLNYIVKARTPLSDFNDYFNTNYTYEECDTIGGYLLHQFSHFPESDETITLGDLTIKILSARSREIRLLSVTRSIQPTGTPACGDSSYHS
jgi:magnesium and cobalt transporter